jgi:hypothetical protein
MMSFSEFRKGLAPNMQQDRVARELYQDYRNPHNNPLEFRTQKRCDLCGCMHEHAFPIQLEGCEACIKAILKKSPELHIFNVKELMSFPKCPLCKNGRYRFLVINPRVCLKCIGRFDKRGRRNHII